MKSPFEVVKVIQEAVAKEQLELVADAKSGIDPQTLPKEGDEDVIVSKKNIRNFQIQMVSRDSDNIYVVYVDEKPVLYGHYGGAGALDKPEIPDPEAIGNALILLMNENEL